MYRAVVTPACQPCKNTFLTENKKLQVEEDIYEFVFEQSSSGINCTQVAFLRHYNCILEKKTN